MAGAHVNRGGDVLHQHEIAAAHVAPVGLQKKGLGVGGHLPGDGLVGAAEWASLARGALLLEHSKLVGDREAIIREANELAAGLLGEPLISSAVAGLCDRLALALGEPSP